MAWSKVAVPFNPPQWRLTDANKQILHKEEGEEEEEKEGEEEEGEVEEEEEEEEEDSGK